MRKTPSEPAGIERHSKRALEGSVRIVPLQVEETKAQPDHLNPSAEIQGFPRTRERVSRLHSEPITALISSNLPILSDPQDIEGTCESGKNFSFPNEIIVNYTWQSTLLTSEADRLWNHRYTLSGVSRCPCQMAPKYGRGGKDGALRRRLLPKLRQADMATQTLDLLQELDRYFSGQ